MSKRQDRPDAIAWLLRHHPELRDQQICKLLGTTKNTVNAVRERTHWKSAEIRPRDPVLIGLCSQIDLDAAVIEARAAQRERESRDLAAAERGARGARSGPGLAPQLPRADAGAQPGRTEARCVQAEAGRAGAPS